MPCFLLDCSAGKILMQLQRKLHKDISTRLQRKFQQHFRTNHHVSSSKTRTSWSTGLIDTLQNYNAEAAGSGVLRVEWTCKVQMPFGPRKSGMPHEVEMPAPVNTTKCWLCTQVHTHIYSSFLISGEKRIAKLQTWKAQNTNIIGPLPAILPPWWAVKVPQPAQENPPCTEILLVKYLTKKMPKALSSHHNPG
jgi:hypothetical protein